MQQYHDILRTILADGVETTDRTGTGTISYFGTQSRYDMADGFPLVTTKKLHIPAIIHELLWFLRGETNIRPLLQDKVRIWTDWPYKVYLKHIEECRAAGEYISEYSKSEFEDMIVKDEDFAARWGDLGPVYGAQWRKWPGQPKQWPTRESTGHVDDTTMPGDIDQIEKLIEQIRKTPDSRRLIVSAWNPAEIEDMALPPCHTLWQVKILGGKLHMQLYQRSGDMFLGVPFNIASYSLLLHMLAHVTGYEPGTFIHTMGDAHIYSNHIEQVQLQLTREHFALPKLVINRKVDSIFDFKFEDFTIENYEAHPHIKGEVAV